MYIVQCMSCHTCTYCTLGYAVTFLFLLSQHNCFHTQQNLPTCIVYMYIQIYLHIKTVFCQQNCYKMGKIIQWMSSCSALLTHLLHNLENHIVRQADGCTQYLRLSVLRASNECVHGPQMKWRSVVALGSGGWFGIHELTQTFWFKQQSHTWQCTFVSPNLHIYIHHTVYQQIFAVKIFSWFEWTMKIKTRNIFNNKW